MNVMVFVAAIFSFALPIGLLIFWKKKTGEELWCFATGAICFVVFATVLESLLHRVVLYGDNAVSRAVLASPVMYTLYASFAAGIFEETGRLVGYKILLKNHYEKECSIAYGIGHGGIEVIIILGIIYVLYFASLLGIQIEDQITTAQIAQIAEMLPPLGISVAIFERLAAVTAHIGLSMIVFVSVRQKGKWWLYPIAIVLHAFLDIPAALYQCQLISSVAFVEIYLLVMSILYVLFGKKMIDDYDNSRTIINTAIVYESNTGHTKEYAEVLSNKIVVPLYSRKEASRYLKNGTRIIYAGWLMGGIVKGYKKASKKFNVESVLAIGMLGDESQREQVLKANKITTIPLFILKGGIEVDKLRGLYKLAIKIMFASVTKGISEKEDKNEMDEAILDIAQNNRSLVEEENLDEFIAWYNGFHLIKATSEDFKKIKDYYKFVIDNTENMSTYCRWVYGLHPNDKLLRRYIDEGAMYYSEKNGEILSSVVILPYQEKEYHNCNWEQELKDDEVVALHLLCSNPKYERNKLGSKTVVEVERIARELNKKAVRLDTLESNLAAQAFYPTLGYEKRDVKSWHADNTGTTNFILYEKVL